MELRPPQEADVEPLAAWLPRVAALLGCDRLATAQGLEELPAQSDVLAITEDGVAGFLCFQAGAPEPDAARVRLLAIEPGRRRLGIGGRAALALEARLAGTSRRIYVAVPSDLGLAFYFWLRLGYRPLTQSEWPAPPERAPGLWMVRELTEAPPRSSSIQRPTSLPPL